MGFLLSVYFLSAIWHPSKQAICSFNDLQFPGLDIIIVQYYNIAKILQYLQYSDDDNHNDDNKINYKKYLQRASCTQCGKITQMSQNHF